MNEFSIAFAIDDVLQLDGEEIAVNLSFDRVLRFFSFSEECRREETDLQFYVDVSLSLLLASPDAVKRRSLRDKEIILKEIIAQNLTPSRNESGHRKTTEPAFDYEQDADIIFASFYQAYGIDLIEQRGRLHWLKFQALLSGLPQSTIFREVTGIRTAKIPPPTKHNAESRENLIRLKQIYALKRTAEGGGNLQDGLQALFAYGIANAKKT